MRQQKGRPARDVNNQQRYSTDGSGCSRLKAGGHVTGGLAQLKEGGGLRGREGCHHMLPDPFPHKFYRFSFTLDKPARLFCIVTCRHRKDSADFLFLCRSLTRSASQGLTSLTHSSFTPTKERKKKQTKLWSAHFLAGSETIKNLFFFTTPLLRKGSPMPLDDRAQIQSTKKFTIENDQRPLDLKVDIFIQTGGGQSMADMPHVLGFGHLHCQESSINCCINVAVWGGFFWIKLPNYNIVGSFLYDLCLKISLLVTTFLLFSTSCRDAT